MSNETNDTLTDKRRYGYFRIDNEIVSDFELTPHEFAVYAAICYHANVKTNKAWPGMATIAKEMGMSRRKVIDCIKELERLKLIHVKRDTKSDGTRAVNHYTLEDVKALVYPDPSESDALPSESDALPLVNEVHKNKTHKQDPITISPNGVAPHETIFEQYERLSKKPLTPVIVDGLKMMAAEHGEAALREAMEHVGSGGNVSARALQQALDGGDGVQVTPAIADYYHALRDHTPQEATISNDMHYLQVAWSLKKNSAISAQDIPALWQHVEKLARDGGWSQYTIAAVDKYTNDYIAKRDAQQQAATDRANRNEDFVPLEVLGGD